MNQARQFITHNHIFINTRKLNVPGYMVLREEESKISFNPSSSLSNEEHPERALPQKEEEKPEVKGKEVKIVKAKPKGEIKETKSGDEEKIEKEIKKEKKAEEVKEIKEEKVEDGKTKKK